MIHLLNIYAKTIAMKYSSRMAYRADFFASIFAFFLYQMTGPIIVALIYYSGGAFAGWTLGQMFILQGTIILIKGFSFMVFFGLLWRLQTRIRKGELEILLLRPIPALWACIMDSFDEEDVGQFLSGIIIMTVAIIILGSIPGSIPIFIALCIMGVLLMFSLALIASGIAIRVVNVDRLYEFIELFYTAGGYPKTIYAGAAGLALTFIIPIFVASFYPAAALLDMPLEGVGTAVGITIVLFTFSLWFWHQSLHKYTSAGG